jgi:hypothetical protein
MLDAIMIALLFLSALCVLIVLADEIRTSVSGLRRRGFVDAVSAGAAGGSRTCRQECHTQSSERWKARTEPTPPRRGSKR